VYGGMKFEKSFRFYLKINNYDIEAMFVSCNSLFMKPFFKLSCVCLLLGKLVNGKHFPIKEKFGLVSKKVFS
jgi:hypothetical protein